MVDRLSGEDAGEPLAARLPGKGRGSITDSVTYGHRTSPSHELSRHERDRILSDRDRIHRVSKAFG